MLQWMVKVAFSVEETAVVYSVPSMAGQSIASCPVVGKGEGEEVVEEAVTVTVLVAIGVVVA